MKVLLMILEFIKKRLIWKDQNILYALLNLFFIPGEKLSFYNSLKKGKKIKITLLTSFKIHNLEGNYVILLYLKNLKDNYTLHKSLMINALCNKIKIYEGLMVFL